MGVGVLDFRNRLGSEEFLGIILTLFWYRVLPPSIAEDVAEEGSRHTLQEEWARPKLEAGASLHEVYPPTGKWFDEFNDWVKTRNSP